MLNKLALSVLLTHSQGDAKCVKQYWKSAGNQEQAALYPLGLGCGEVGESISQLCLHSLASDCLVHHLPGMWTSVFLWHTTNLAGFVFHSAFNSCVAFQLKSPVQVTVQSRWQLCWHDKGTRGDEEAGHCQLGLLTQAIPYRKRAGSCMMLGGVMDVVPAPR